MIIRLKRGTKAQIQSATLQIGEPAFATDTDEFVIQGNSGKIFISTNADKVDGFHASQTPTANTILPLNANARIYNYVARGSQILDPTNFTLSNSTEYLVGSINITTPSWSPSGAWKVIFVVISGFHSTAVGANNFQQRIRFDTNLLTGAFWYWHTYSAGNTIGVSDTLMSDLENGITQSYSFHVYQGGGNAGAVFEWMRVDWYLIPA